MTLYGDLDSSVIDELPAGRKPIMTAHRSENQRLRVYHFIQEQLEQGRQAYIVFPLIEESENADYEKPDGWLLQGFGFLSYAQIPYQYGARPPETTGKRV